MIRAHVYRTAPGEWCAELRHEQSALGSLGWRYASTWRRAMLFAEIGLRKGQFPDHPMSGERFPQRREEGQGA